MSNGHSELGIEVVFFNGSMSTHSPKAYTLGVGDFSKESSLSR